MSSRVLSIALLYVKKETDVDEHRILETDEKGDLRVCHSTGFMKGKCLPVFEFPSIL